MHQQRVLRVQLIAVVLQRYGQLNQVRLLLEFCF